MKKYIWIVLAIALILRIWQLDKNPVSLFGDELDVGYHAYSLMQTGKDYTGHFLPLHLRSFSEYRTPLYIYAAVPTVAVFGITPWGVRLPAAIFGVLSIWALYLLINLITGKKSIGLLAAILLTLTPWHLQFSRAGFEVTQLLFLYIIGLYLFLRGLKEHKYLVWSALSLALTPWVYSTAKLFLPLTVVALLILWWRDIWNIPTKKLIVPIAVFVIIAGTFAWSTIYGGGAERIEGISIFSNVNFETELGQERSIDVNSKLTTQSRVFHNKFTDYFSDFSTNYLKAFSTDFLFINGDPNMRHSPLNTGELFGFELVFLVFGMMFFFDTSIKGRYRALMFFWLVAGPIPSAFTLGGGSHATRLILVLPVLVTLISYGLLRVYQLIPAVVQKKAFVVMITAIYLVCFINYQHTYWAHYPIQSQRFWQAGYEEAIKSAVSEGEKYEKVIISNASDPTQIFFLAWSQYPVKDFQQQYPLQTMPLAGFGDVEKLGKYYFTSMDAQLIFWDLGRLLPDNTLFLITQKQSNVDLINDPGRLPRDLRLIKSIAYPDGSPAFYLITKNKQLQN